MASTSSSSTSHTDAAHTFRYDVFLSFRGEDTRHTFTDHLYKALTGAGIRTFRDNEEIQIGLELKPEIETAIKKSGCSIVVLSENYADSRWCLNELSLIMVQRRNCNHIVLPIFYHVDPSDVRNQRGNFAIEGLKGTEDDVRRWKAALTDVAGLSGMVPSGSEAQFITEVVHEVHYRQHLKLPTTHLVGMETRVEVFNSWLKNEKSNAIAICGMGGTGKTTLAKYVYNLNKQNFGNSTCFVEEIGKHYNDGPLELQKKLLKGVLGIRDIQLSGVSEGTGMIEEALQGRKMLIVLDDIDDEEELRTLLGTKTFPTQSKIIITTRHRDIDLWCRSISWSCLVYNLEVLNDIQSRELLCWHAFGSKFPMEGFEDLALQLAQYCGGNPLALEVLGSSLAVSDKDPRERNAMIDIWRERMDSLNSSKVGLDLKIQVVLRKSFDSLQFDNHKALFLDIACFFDGETKDRVTAFRADLKPKYGIMTLIKKCLLTVSPDTGVLRMHQLLQDMGRKIVSDESIQPITRSRVWNNEESCHILRKGQGSDTIEGLALDMLEKENNPEFKTSSLAKMEKLKFLRLKFVDLNGSYKKFPELTGLCWHGCRLRKMPLGLLKSSLVAIDMSHGRMKKFEAPTL